jgi:site-specific recombinase XerC
MKPEEAQGVLDTTGNIKVTQEILGHDHLSTTADLYMRVDQQGMVSSLTAVKTGGRAQRSATNVALSESGTVCV